MQNKSAPNTWFLLLVSAILSLSIFLKGPKYKIYKKKAEPLLTLPLINDWYQFY
jgi:hypothetical protein